MAQAVAASKTTVRTQVGAVWAFEKLRTRRDKHGAAAPTYHRLLPRREQVRGAKVIEEVAIALLGHSTVATEPILAEISLDPSRHEGCKANVWPPASKVR